MKPNPLPGGRTAILSLATVLLASSIAAAQPPPAPAPPAAAPQTGLVWSVDFAQRVTGRHLIITTSDGRLYEGTVTVSPTGLETTGTTNAAVAFNQIVRIEKPTYRVRLGVIWGAVAGATTGLIAACTVETHCGDEAFLLSLALGGLGTGVGAAIGGALNRAHRNDDILYDSNRRTTTMAIAPILSPARKGVAVRVTWR
jgi:hypothetical protein